MNEMKGNHIKRGKLFQKSLTESVKFNYSAKMKNETPIKVYLRNYVVVAHVILVSSPVPIGLLVGTTLGLGLGLGLGGLHLGLWLDNFQSKNFVKNV